MRGCFECTSTAVGTWAKCCWYWRPYHIQRCTYSVLSYCRTSVLPYFLLSFQWVENPSTITLFLLHPAVPSFHLIPFVYHPPPMGPRPSQIHTARSPPLHSPCPLNGLSAPYCTVSKYLPKYCKYCKYLLAPSLAPPPCPSPVFSPPPRLLLFSACLKSLPAPPFASFFYLLHISCLFAPST